MQRKGFLVLMGLLVLALAGAPALAGTVSLTQTNDLSIQGINASDPALSAFAYGVAFGSTTQGPDSATVYGNPANAAIPYGPYLVTTQATTSANSTVSMFQNMLAVAPDDISGSTYQQTNNDALFTFRASSSGIVGAVVTDSYSQQFSLTNSAAYAAFSSLYAYNDLTATLTDLTKGTFATTSINLLSFPVDNNGYPLEDFAANTTDKPFFFIGLDGVCAGDCLTLELSLDASLSGGTTGGTLEVVPPPPPAAVPLPPSFLLLGGGLAGLFLTRRWHRA